MSAIRYATPIGHAMHAPRNHTLVLHLLLAAAMLAGSSSASAQIRGRQVRAPRQPWWFSAGASAAVLGDVHDGVTGSNWRFGNDPLLLLRGSLEKSLDEATTLGVVVAYGRVPLTVTPLDGVAIALPDATTSGTLPDACRAQCTADTDIWQAMGQFRSGGGPGFHTFFEGNAGVTSFRNMKTRAEKTPIGKASGTIDLSGTLGAGFGYTVSPGFAITLVQDFGIGYHSKTNLPDGTSRTWRMRNTRAALRYSF